MKPVADIDLRDEIRRLEYQLMKAEQEWDEALSARDQALHFLGDCQDQRRATEARLRDLTEAADRVARLAEYDSGLSVIAAVANYRRVRDAQPASPEPESPRSKVFQQQVRTLREIGASIDRLLREEAKRDR